MSGTYRNEYKYLIGAASAELIRHRLGALIDRDSHANANGDYFIRSVYFDDDGLSAYHDKLAGVSHRVVQGQADMGTVFRLQAMAGSIAMGATAPSRVRPP